MTQRVNFVQQSPELYRKYSEFSLATRQGSIEPAIRNLVTLRASQLNGCAFCVDMHVKEARIDGERELRLHHVAVWRESNLFTPRERAALAWTETLTKLPAQGVADEAYEPVRAQLSEREIADLAFIIVGINGWNRLSVGFGAVPGSADKTFGLDKANLA